MSFDLRSIFKKVSIGLLSLSILGVSSGDNIELQTHFNARYSANFTKNSKNVKTVLPPKTKAKVTEVKTMPSGNLGLRVKVLEGPEAGETVWVYYKKSQPLMKLYSSENATEAEVDGSDTTVIKSAQTTKSIDGLKEPELDAKIKMTDDEAGADVVASVEAGNKAVTNLTTNNRCKDCDTWTFGDTNPIGSEDKARDSSYRGGNSISSKATSGLATRNTKTRSPACRTTGTFESCTYAGDSRPSDFRIINNGGNRVTNNSSRNWTFMSPSFATQDLGIYIEDHINNNFDQMSSSYVMLFPRNQVMSVNVSGEQKAVNLPTGEKVIFNNRTNEVIGGVFAENTRASGGNSTQGVRYKGQGVMVRTDASGVNEPKMTGMATITKGSQVCKVPVNQLWEQNNNSQNSFKYPDDSQFSNFLSSKCGFSL